MKLYKILVMFIKSLMTFQHVVSLTSVTANDYIYSMEKNDSDIGVGENKDGVGINRFVPLELNSNHKRAFTSAGIIGMGAIWDQQQLSKSIRNRSAVADRNYNGKMVSVDDYNNVIFQSKLSRNGDFIFGTLMTVIGLVSLVGNGCILVVFHCRRWRLTPVEILLLNLGIVDILLYFASYPFTMISSFKHRWDFGELGCILYAFVSYFLELASIFSITAIALIRYWKTCTPVTGNKITCWTSYKAIACGYLLALLWAIPPLIGFGSYGPEPYGLSCTLEWVARDNASRIYLLLVTIFCVLLPLLLIIFCYCQIILLVRKSEALVRNNGVKKRNVNDTQLTWISGLVSLGFIIGWGPYSVVSLWASLWGEVMLPMWATPIPVTLAKSSIAYNPFIYIFFTARYREDLVTLCRYWICSYSKVRTDKNPKSGGLSRTRNGNDGNNRLKVSPVISGISSLLTKQLTTTTNSNSNNNITPKHNEEPVTSQTQLEKQTNYKITTNMVDSIYPHDLSIGIVGEEYANNNNSHVIIRVVHSM